jgi:hypothetical protein
MPFAIASFAKRDGSTPVVFSISPMPVAPGQKVSIHVGLSQTTTINQIVTISTSTPGNWGDLPSQVVVTAGHSGITFPATVSANGSGMIDAAATCNGVSISTCSAIVSK